MVLSCMLRIDQVDWRFDGSAKKQCSLGRGGRAIEKSSAIRAVEYEHSSQSNLTIAKGILGSIAPSVMIPKHRLAVLLDQVKQNQISHCLYHNPSSSPSLFSDHMCDRSQFPLRTVLELTQNAGEVWAMEFSHDGRRLATSGQATDVLIYETSTFQLLYRLTEHTDHVASLAWSPDDSKLITCSHDKTARVWDMLVCVTALIMPAVPLTNHRSPAKTC